MFHPLRDFLSDACTIIFDGFRSLPRFFQFTTRRAPLTLHTDPKQRAELFSGFHEPESAAARERAGRRGHRLDGDVVLILQRVDLRVRIAREEFHGDSAAKSEIQISKFETNLKFELRKYRKLACWPVSVIWTFPIFFVCFEFRASDFLICNGLRKATSCPAVPSQPPPRGPVRSRTSFAVL
jgi:hypothetical protein